MSEQIDKQAHNAGRRRVLAGSLSVGFTLLPFADAFAQTTEAGTFKSAAPKLPGRDDEQKRRPR